MNLKHWSFPLISILSLLFLVLLVCFYCARVCACTPGAVMVVGGGVGGGGRGGWSVGRSESICCGRMLPFRPMKVINELQKIINQSANCVPPPPPPPPFAHSLQGSLHQYFSILAHQRVCEVPARVLVCVSR